MARELSADESARREWATAIYEPNAAGVSAYLRRRTDPGTAEELLIEVFLVAWTRREAAPEPTRHRAWLFVIARNLLANQRRREATRSRTIVRLAGQRNVGPGEPDIGDTGSVRAVLERLSEQDRELLTLVAWDGLDREEIAVVMGWSTANMSVRLHRARKSFARVAVEQGLDLGVQGPGAVRHVWGGTAPAPIWNGVPDGT